MKQTAHLENWFVSRECVWGHVSGHPRLRDGTFVRTSNIVKLDRANKTCETLNTHYTLGQEAKVDKPLEVG